MLDANSFTIVDVETTGAHPWFNRVIEVGVLRVEKGEVIETFETLVNPETAIPEFITNMTGIPNEDVAGAPVFDEIKDKLIALFEGSVFVAHNVDFDYNFLQSEFQRVGYGFTADKLCTVRLSRVLYPAHKRHNLSALIERFKFECKRRHRALDDAKVLWDFLQLVESAFPQDDVNRAIYRTIQQLSPAQQRKLGARDEIVYDEELQG